MSNMSTTLNGPHGHAAHRTWTGLLACLACVAALQSLSGAPAAMKSRLQKTVFGKTQDGAEVHLYTLTNSRGVVAKVTTYGAILTELHVPDREGKLANVVMGFDKLEEYLKGHPGFGAPIGRYANRIGGAKFTIDGKEYTLAKNNGPNHIHGGIKGFDKYVWTAEPSETKDSASVKFTRLSPDGEEGYPGSLSVSITYTLTDANELRIDYTGTTDKPTVINLTNHSYFNLAGSGDVLAQELMIAASNYTPADEGLIPTGEIKSVKSTPLDFTTPTTIGAHINDLPPHTRGYDHNFVIDGGGKSLTLAARARDPKSGRAMEVWTTEPGVQLYTGNWLDGKRAGVGGVVYKQHHAFCLETQHYPDSPNKPNFPSPILRPGQTFSSTTTFRFSAE